MPYYRFRGDPHAIQIFIWVFMVLYAILYICYMDLLKFLLSRETLILPIYVLCVPYVMYIKTYYDVNMVMEWTSYTIMDVSN
jgi:hypothetical protein